MAAAAARDTRTAAQRNHDALSAMFRVILESGILGRHRGMPVAAIISMTLDQLGKAAGGVATTATGGLLPVDDALKLAEPALPCPGARRAHRLGDHQRATRGRVRRTHRMDTAAAHRPGQKTANQSPTPCR
ncbi:MULTISPECIES: DUF222 domain-containing protein [unclassified Rhodococcus (in: high G+C Gram-positive bacteria)]|uniref:DUF222 domain-containing protein n=1 Tax=unclassified Rhodococcus (in: high G+C Gram-positive bacteria) TaxID=192944 RepID=UPI0028A04E60|nr:MULTISPECIES: DUF222 domain-containing protein [unclassified Rhodococcus (in: high G+C Gram-positive bacteria)]